MSTELLDIPQCIQSLQTAIESNMPKAALMGIATELSKAWNRECDESDKLMDDLERRDLELHQLKRACTDLELKEKLWRDQAAAQSKAASRADNLYRQLKVDYSLAKKALEKANRALEVEIDDHKRTKAQVKRNKESAEKYQVRAKSLEKATSELREDIRRIENRSIELGRERLQLINELTKIKMMSVWADNDEGLFMLPERIRIQIEGQKTIGRAYTLLYTNSFGIWRQAAIGSDYKVSFSKFAYCDGVDKEKTDIANEVLPTPSETAKKIAQRWLYKVNIVQNALITEEDLNIRNVAEYLKEIGELQESA
ncbi:TPA: hypothetical protein RSW55_003754 [Vibrio vulnificus]|nr:hypothetical protein [Vibrio vulnificus]